MIFKAQAMRHRGGAQPHHQSVNNSGILYVDFSHACYSIFVMPAQSKRIQKSNPRYLAI